MAARTNFSSPMSRTLHQGALLADVPRVLRFTCQRCGVRCEPENNIGCSHQAERISARDQHHVGGIIR